MRNNIISKIFKNNTIFFDSIDETVYLNATQTAKFFKTTKGNSKDLNEWLSSKPTKEYIQILQKSDPEIFGNTQNIDKIEFIKVIKGNFSDGRMQGTWIHKSLIILFARWLSPDFAVWCDFQIEEILKSKNSKPVKTSQNFDLDSYILENEKLIKLIKLVTSENAITLHYLDKLTQKLNLKSPIDLLEIDLNSYYFIPTELGKFLNKSAVEINKILEKKGFQEKINGVWKLTDTGKNYAIQLDNNFSTIKWKLEAIL